jgi:hypothetical protein
MGLNIFTELFKPQVIEIIYQIEYRYVATSLNR